MANLFTSELLSLNNNSLDILIDRVEDLAGVKLSVAKYSSSDQLLGEVLPQITYVENGGCPEDKTRLRIYCNEGQVLLDEKVKLSLDSNL